MIEVTKEPMNTAVAERCIFCKEPTRHWHMRTNTPVCTDCAEEKRVSDIEWEKYMIDFHEMPRTI